MDGIPTLADAGFDVLGEVSFLEDLRLIEANFCETKRT